MEQNQPNKDYIIQSLQNQLSQAQMQIAQRDAVITEQYDEMEKLKQKDGE